VFAPLIVPFDPIATSWAVVRKPPSALHWFGTDDLGRDIFGRVIYGARASLTAGVISVGIALGIGVPFGMLSGYRGGFVDALISRITDAMLAWQTEHLQAIATRSTRWVVEVRPELVVEITFDHVSAGRIRHGTKILRWREDKDPADCRFDQLT